MLIELYSAKQFIKVDEYVKGVLDGSIIANRYVIKAVERYVRDLEREDLVFDRDKVGKVFKFFSLMNVSDQDDYNQFDLQPFQAFIIVNIYGFYWKETGLRRFRYSYEEMARKSGKTTFSVGRSQYHLVADGVLDPQVLFLATTRDQAGTALMYAKSIVMNSPVLSKRVEITQYFLRFTQKKNGKTSTGILKTLASNADHLDSYSPSYVLIDEYHAHKTDDILRVMMSGTKARREPLINIITTAGFDLDKPCYHYRQSAINVLEGQAEADDLFAIIFTLDEGDDYTDTSLWVKSNPALGKITQIADLMSDFNQAKITPSLLNNFLTKNLNLWVTNDQGWIEDKELDKVFDYGLDISEFKGMDCYVGVDLSSTRDLTACVLLFEREGMFYAFPYFFMANNPQKKIRKGGINVGTWVRQGFVIECQTKTIDYDLLFEHFEKWHYDYNINAIGYDYYNSALIIPRVEALGVDCVKVPQTAQAFNFPIKYTEKLIYDDKIRLTNPVLKWNIRNIVLYQDGNGNQKFLKNKSLDSIDGAVALAEAIAMWIQTNLDPERLMLESYIGEG